MMLFIIAESAVASTIIGNGVLISTPNGCVPSGSHNTDVPQPPLVGVELNPGPPGKKKKSFRARPNKSNNKSMQSISRGPSSQTWSVGYQQMPGFRRVAMTENKIYTFVQTLNVGTVLTTSITVPVNQANSFTATAYINQFSSFAAIFDQYRIDQVECWLVPTSATPNEQNSGFMYSAIDYDDAAASTPASLAQRTNVIVTPLSLGHYHKFKPHVALAAYSGAFSSFANQSGQWIDSASASVQHYGLKYSSDITPIVYIVDLLVRIQVSFKNVA